MLLAKIIQCKSVNKNLPMYEPNPNAEPAQSINANINTEYCKAGRSER